MKTQAEMNTLASTDKEFVGESLSLKLRLLIGIEVDYINKYQSYLLDLINVDLLIELLNSICESHTIYESQKINLYQCNLLGEFVSYLKDKDKTHIFYKRLETLHENIRNEHISFNTQVNLELASKIVTHLASSEITASYIKSRDFNEGLLSILEKIAANKKITVPELISLHNFSQFVLKHSKQHEEMIRLLQKYLKLCYPHYYAVIKLLVDEKVLVEYELNKGVANESIPVYLTTSQAVTSRFNVIEALAKIDFAKYFVKEALAKTDFSNKFAKIADQSNTSRYERKSETERNVRNKSGDISSSGDTSRSYERNESGYSDYSYRNRRAKDSDSWAERLENVNGAFDNAQELANFDYSNTGHNAAVVLERGLDLLSSDSDSRSYTRQYNNHFYNNSSARQAKAAVQLVDNTLGLIHSGGNFAAGSLSSQVLPAPSGDCSIM